MEDQNVFSFLIISFQIILGLYCLMLDDEKELIDTLEDLKFLAIVMDKWFRIVNPVWGCFGF